MSKTVEDCLKIEVFFSLIDSNLQKCKSIQIIAEKLEKSNEIETEEMFV